MARLARYIDNLATLLGEKNSVHLMSIEEGSTIPVLAVQREAYPKVKKRIHDVQHGKGPEQSRKARRAIELDLIEDCAEHGDLIVGDDKILTFPGTTQTGEPEYGPFSQVGTLDGVPIAVGGVNDPVPVHLQAPDAIHNCTASRELARNIGKHLFSTPLRVTGTGRWLRDRDGVWLMKAFRISNYVELRAESLSVTTERLRGIDAAWKLKADPLGELVDLRRSEG